MHHQSGVDCAPAAASAAAAWATVLLILVILSAVFFHTISNYVLLVSCCLSLAPVTPRPPPPPLSFSMCLAPVPASSSSSIPPLPLSLLSLSLSISIQDSKRFLQWQPWLWEPSLDWQAVPTPLCEFLCTFDTTLSLLLAHTLASLNSTKRTNVVVRVEPRRTPRAGLFFIFSTLQNVQNMNNYRHVFTVTH